jgi:hypothetical protein
MEDKEPSIMDAQTQTEVYDVSSCSIYSQYETNVGMKLLTKMGYRGGGTWHSWPRSHSSIRGGTKTMICRFGLWKGREWRMLKGC